jgi:hypothetical protein
VRVPADVLEALGEFTGHSWSDALSLEPFICEAIRNYVQPAPKTGAQLGAASEAGYQWKQVFLPSGTRLRTSFGGRRLFAQVAGDEIMYDGLVVSPSGFANLQGSGNRNAWKTIWICLPGSQEWMLAEVYRLASNARIETCSMAARRSYPEQ